MAETKVQSDTVTSTKKNKVAKVKKSDMKAKNGTSGWSKFLTLLQELGKALQFPITMLPFAAILNRFGTLGVQYTTDAAGNITNEAGYWISFIIQSPGAAAFNNLPLMFAIGVAFGLAKDHRGEVALVGALFYLILAAMTAENTLPSMLYKHVLTFHWANDVAMLPDKDHATAWIKHTEGDFSKLFYVKTYADDGSTIVGGAYVLNIGVLGGIVAGCFSAYLYNRLKDIKLPTALSFFGGRRFVPMVAMCMSIVVALGFAIVWPWIQYVLMLMGQAIADPENPAVAIPGTALYAFLNRILLPFGLHQILNTFFWFQLPIHGQQIGTISGNVLNNGAEVWVNGDINAFIAGVSTAGLFQSGFFPVMMGGIPAIAVAMIFTAKKENRKQVAGFLGGIAAVSFISGITEPIEFSFVFLSPLLLVIHAGMTAIFVAITTAMHIQIGFGFSAGFIDYCVSFAQSWGLAAHQSGAYHTLGNPLWIWPLIVACAAAYFFVFYFAIKGLNIATPGREDGGLGAGANAFAEDDANAKEATSATKGAKPAKGVSKYEMMAQKIVDTIGMDNFVTVDNCTTRLRLVVKDNTTFEDGPIKAVGAFGVKRLGTEGVQIVIGSNVEHVANEMKKITGK